MPTTLEDFYRDAQLPAERPGRVSVPTKAAAPKPPTLRLTQEQRALLKDAVGTVSAVGRLSEQAGISFGKVGVVAVVALAAFGGYKWYKAQQKPTPRRSRRIKASLLGG